jgi:hypothetical protein
MAWYRVLLHCVLPEGFSRDDEAIAGFYTTRFVEAPFDKAAGDAAIDLLQGEQKFRDLRAQLSADPAIEAAEIEPWGEAPEPDARKIGFVFYPVNERPEDAA